MSDFVPIMQAIHAVQATIATPAGAAKALQIPADIQPPPNLGVFPIFVNSLTDLHVLEGDYSGRTFGNAARHDEWVVYMHLCFAPMDFKYQVQQQWLWTDPVLAVFDQNPLLQGVCDSSLVGNVDFRPCEYNGVKYVCSTFPLHLTTRRLKGT